MGIVEVLPGFSGGTMALITGIYSQLVKSLQQIGFEMWRRFDRSELAEAVRFLVPLGVGMVVGISISILTVLEFVDTHPVIFWGMIFGMLIGVLIQLTRELTSQAAFVFVPLGLLIGIPLAFSFSTPNEELWVYFVGGFGAFIAWMLPGISGSMVLVLLGIWLHFLNAIKSVEIDKLVLFAAGACLALSVMPRLVSVLLERYKPQTMSFFWGLVASCLLQAWPWRASWGEPTFPMALEEEPQIWVVGLTILGGIALVLLIPRVIKRVT